MESKIVLSTGKVLVDQNQLAALVASRPAQVIRLVNQDQLVNKLTEARREWDQLTASGVDREGLAEAGALILADILALANGGPRSGRS